MTVPKPDDMRAAAEWLRCYEPGAEEPAKRMNAVADWLDDEADRREYDSMIRRKSRETGISASRIRAAMKKLREKE